MVDFHTHILPGIDDGSRDSETTKALLCEEKRQGIKLIVATPHFYANRVSIERFLEMRSGAMIKTKKLTEEADEPLPEIISGAEVYYFEGIGNASEIGKLCISETRTILLEMPFGQWNAGMMKDIEGLIFQQRLNVVLAHVERYCFFQKDRRIWDRIMELPLTPQMNAEGFLRKRKLLRSDRQRQLCFHFLSGHPNIILGSDCHNMEGRAPNLAAARAEIETAMGQEVLECIDETTRNALELHPKQAGETRRAIGDMLTDTL